MNQSLCGLHCPALCWPNALGSKVVPRNCRFRLPWANTPEICLRSAQHPPHSYSSCEADSVPTPTCVTVFEPGQSDTNLSGNTDWLEMSVWLGQSQWNTHKRLFSGFLERAVTLALWIRTKGHVKVWAAAAICNFEEIMYLRQEPTLTSKKKRNLSETREREKIHWI
jgi:hypothetical protein